MIFASLAGCDNDSFRVDSGTDADGDPDADVPDGDADADGGPVAPCPSDMILIDDGIDNAFCIDKFEHPNEEGQAPTIAVAWYMAREACVDDGKQLCFEDQWVRACVGTPAESCAGNQAASGLRPACASDFGVRDMPGNVAEWTATPGGSVSFFTRGGVGGSDVSCDVREEIAAETRRGDLGFRCCKAARRND